MSADHLGECGCQRRSDCTHGEPIAFFRPDRLIERKRIRSKEHLIWEEKEPTAKDILELGRIEIEFHERGVKVNIPPRSEPDGLILEWITAVQQHESGLFIARVAKYVFKLQDVVF